MQDQTPAHFIKANTVEVSHSSLHNIEDISPVKISSTRVEFEERVVSHHTTVKTVQMIHTENLILVEESHESHFEEQPSIPNEDDDN